MRRTMLCLARNVFAAGCLSLCFASAASIAQTTTTKTEWKADVSKATIPQHPASGRIHGQKFTVEKVEISSNSPAYFMHIRQGKDFFADKEFEIVLRTRKGETLSGKSIMVHPGSAFDQPGVIQEGNVRFPPVQGLSMSYKVPNATLPKEETNNSFTLHLQFGKLHGDRLPGGIYLAMNDKSKSYVAGTFTAVVSK